MSESLQEILALAFVGIVLLVTVVVRLRARWGGRPPACHGCPSADGCVPPPVETTDDTDRRLPLYLRDPSASNPPAAR